MRSTLRLSLFAALAATAATAFAQQKSTEFQQSYRSTYTASCMREFNGASEGRSAERGTAICSCVATTLTRNLDDKQLLNLDDRLTRQGTKGDAFAAIREITGECAKPEVPEQVEKDPGHLGNVIRKYPDLLK